MSPLTASSGLAIMFGLGLAGFETLVNWGQWQWWPWWLVDYVAAGLLLVAGIAVLQNRSWGPKLLCAGWGFALGMMWMSLAGNIASGTDPDRAARVAGLYIALIVFSMVLCLLGFLLAMIGDKKRTG